MATGAAASGKRHGDFSAYAIAFNRGKRSVAIDLKRPEGREVVAQLVARADVVIENNRPGVLARFKLDYEQVRASNPDVVYVSVTGFGQDGPNRDLPATDSILQAYSGLMSVNRDAAGMPQRIGVLVIDVVTGLYAHQAAATALYRRATRGGGRHVTVSLMDAIGAVQAGKILEFHLEGEHGAAGRRAGRDLRGRRRLHHDQRAPRSALRRAVPDPRAPRARRAIRATRRRPRGSRTRRS